jgi:hypothetical protein
MVNFVLLTAARDLAYVQALRRFMAKNGYLS